MTDKPKLTKKDIEAQNAMIAYQEVNEFIRGNGPRQDHARMNYLSEFLEPIKTQQGIDDFLTKNTSIIMQLPIILREAFLKGALEDRDKLNETEGK